MRYFLGVDGGGTKTEAVLFQEDGAVIRRTLGPATNPHGLSPEEAEARVKEILRNSSQDYPIEAAFLGVAGTGGKIMGARYGQWAREALPRSPHVANGSDVCCTITAALGKADGIAAIAGTGSSTFVRANGAYFPVGGWGYFFEDAGSGFEFGRNALIHWMRVSDGRDMGGELARLCAEHAGGTALQSLTRLYEQGRTEIAAYAPCVFQAAEAGDEAARRIICRQAEMYGELLRAGAKRIAERPVKVALGGSIWKQPAFLHQVRASAGEGFEFISSSLPPVYGAALEACYACALEPNHHFRDTFAETYGEIIGK